MTSKELMQILRRFPKEAEILIRINNKEDIEVASVSACLNQDATWSIIFNAAIQEKVEKNN